MSTRPQDDTGTTGPPAEGPEESPDTLRQSEPQQPAAAAGGAAVGGTERQGASLLAAGKPRWGERVAMGVLFACGAVSIVTTIGIVFILFEEAASFFREVGWTRLFTDTQWAPFLGVEQGTFGIRELIAGTLLVTVIALTVATPLGLASAAYLSEYAPGRVRRVLKPVLEVLAGVPTVVLGYFALTFMTPVLRAIFGQDSITIFNAASAGIVMGIMIVPTIASLSEDAMSAVPQALRDGSYGLGATKRQTVTSVVFPAALSGIVGAVVLAIGRAIGETMIVAIAAGNNPDFTLNPGDDVQTMTAYIVQVVQGEAPRGSISYASIFVVGAALFLMTFTISILAQRIVQRFRQVY